MLVIAADARYLSLHLVPTHHITTAALLAAVHGRNTLLSL
jgi:hypothetical protein